MDFRSLIPFKDKDTLGKLHDEVDRVFDSFLKMPPWEWGNGFLSPHVDMAETDKEIVVTAEFPGVEEEDVNVILEDNQLTIQGEKKKEEEKKGTHYYHSERSYGKFVRTFTIPHKIKPSDINATFEKGVLTVTIPKPKGSEAMAHKIKLKTKK